MDSVLWLILFQASAALIFLFAKTVYYYITKGYMPTMALLGVYIDQKFTIREKDAICNALRRWEQATKGLVGFTIINASTVVDIDSLKKVKNYDQIDNILFVRSYAEDKEIIELEKKYKTGILGAADLTYSPKVIFLVADRRNNLDKLRDTATHEIGHILWLQHSKDKKSIMFRRPTRYNQKITLDDVRRVYSYLGFFMWGATQDDSQEEADD